MITFRGKKVDSKRGVIYYIKRVLEKLNYYKKMKERGVIYYITK